MLPPRSQVCQQQVWSKTSPVALLCMSPPPRNKAKPRDFTPGQVECKHKNTSPATEALDAPPPYVTATQSTARLQEFYTRTDAAQPSSTVDWCQNGIASELIWGKLTPVHAAEPACRCRTAVEHLVDARCRCAAASVAWLAGVGEVDADAVVRICDELKWWWWWIWSTRCRIPR